MLYTQDAYFSMAPDMLYDIQHNQLEHQKYELSRLSFFFFFFSYFSI
jgi:hypothetical protein